MNWSLWSWYFWQFPWDSGSINRQVVDACLQEPKVHREGYHTLGIGLTLAPKSRIVLVKRFGPIENVIIGFFGSTFLTNGVIIFAFFISPNSDEVLPYPTSIIWIDSRLSLGLSNRAMAGTGVEAKGLHDLPPPVDLIGCAIAHLGFRQICTGATMCDQEACKQTLHVVQRGDCVPLILGDGVAPI